MISWGSERRYARSPEEEDRIRENQKVAYGRRVSTKVPDFAEGEQILVRKGLDKQSKFSGPFTIMGEEEKNGVSKRIPYSDGVSSKTASLRNIIKYCPRRDISQGGGGGGGGV